MRKILHCGFINGNVVEVIFSVVYELKINDKSISFSNSLDNIHGDMFECLMCYFEDKELSKEKVNKLFYDVYLFVDIVKQSLDGHSTTL